MVISVAELVREVRVAIDMNREDSGLIGEGNAETLSLDELIESKLADAVRLVEMEAPSRMLESGHDFGGGLEDAPFMDDDGRGFVILPDDFMRLVAFRMSDWSRTVYDAIGERDARYLLQSSRRKGICGNAEKPVCALVRRSEGKVLEFYSCRSKDARIVQATYRPEPRIDSRGGIEVSRECRRAVVYRAGALALASLGDQQYGVMLEISKSLMG